MSFLRNFKENLQGNCVNFFENFKKNSQNLRENSRIFNALKNGVKSVNFLENSQKKFTKLREFFINSQKNSRIFDLNSLQNVKEFHIIKNYVKKKPNLHQNCVNFLKNSQGISHKTKEFHSTSSIIDFDSKPLFLAPMAGFSDLPFRSVVKKFGVDVTTSEMISANALVFDSKKTLRMLEKAANETPFIVQIAASDENIIKKAVQLLNEVGGIDGIDLNCGCPVPKVVRQNAGAALLCDLPRLQRLVSTIKEHSKKRYTSVKMRLGFANNDAVGIAKACEAAGADYIAIHGRTRTQFYDGKCDFAAITAVKSAVKVPIIANGDINLQNYSEILRLTNADGMMIGRACVGKPWLFYELRSGLSVSKALKKEIILCHFDAMLAHYGLFGVKLFRKHLHSYCKGIKDAAKFRELINKEENEIKVRKLIEKFL